ncbi:MAG: hypothetical protein IT364_13205 [Candidatus Hydrogenedentes bacterium]|nr:hypothetical protein [Candidatus Hydrogenedentota bacterium]
MSTMREALVCPGFVWGSLKSMAIVAAVYGISYAGMTMSGTLDLVPGAHHTICMIIFGLGYIVSSGKVQSLRHA